jgi:hypothetical protein
MPRLTAYRQGPHEQIAVLGSADPVVRLLAAGMLAVGSAALLQALSTRLRWASVNGLDVAVLAFLCGQVALLVLGFVGVVRRSLRALSATSRLPARLSVVRVLVMERDAVGPGTPHAATLEQGPHATDAARKRAALGDARVCIASQPPDSASVESWISHEADGGGACRGEERSR